jgi:hypothetical protein
MFHKAKRRSTTPLRDGMIIISERVGPVSAPPRLP